MAEQPSDNVLKILVMLRWLELDPERAIQVATESSYHTQAWGYWGRIDPDSALPAAEKAGRSSVHSVLVAVAMSDPRKAMKLLERYPDMDLEPTVLLGLERTEGPRVALEFHYDLNVLNRWAARDSRGALEWALANPSLLEKPRDWEALARELFSEHPAHLDEVIASLPADDQARRALESYRVQNLVASDLERALALMEEPGANRYLPLRVGELIAEEHPRASLELFRELHDRDPLLAAQSGDWIGSLLAYNDPAEVAAIAAESDSRALHVITDQWMWQDRLGFAQWVQTRPGEERDNHLRDLAEATTEANQNLYHEELFREALGYATGIESESTRRAAIGGVLHNWITESPHSAERYLEATPENAEFQAAFKRISEESR